ncbi:unnamed protein product [Hymenolepis diminuta]|uniref:Cyclic nucleotide-binding domain-containing protein n=2 Tax=Hymenolepis diminuta TaxID=6216 RepID=A0A3P6VV94_HYMDI|nr:unnamed protein product [Hymenolepis diminuta]
MTGGPNRTSIYITSLYFTMSSLTSVGFGNVSPNTVNEKIFSIVSMLVGALMHAAVFGNVTTIIQRMYTRRSAYQTKNQDLKDFTRAHHLPKQLRQRMLEFYQAMWSINRGIDKQTIMQVFPEEMRGDIAMHINREMLSLPIFKTASIGCQKSIAQLIGTRFATPGEFLVHRGDAIRNLYYVCSGSLEILDEDGSVVALLGKCDLFGTDIDQRPFIGLSAFEVKALTYCELQYIMFDASLFSVLDLYPNYSKEFSAALHDELSFNIKEGYDPFAKDEIETLEAITKHPSPSPHSPSSSHQSFCEPASDCRPNESVNTSLHRALEEGTLDTSLDLRGSQEHLLGKIHQTRWYLPSSSIDSDSTPAVKKLVEKESDLKIKDSDESIASRMKRSFLFTHRSSRVNRQRSNLSMDSFIPPSDETEVPDSAARRICSIERVNEACLIENCHGEVPPPTPNLTPPTCEPSEQLSSNSSSIMSGAEQKELKVLLFKLLRDVQEMRTDLQSLATEVSSLKQQQQITRPLQVPQSEPSLQQHQYPLKSSIMKPPPTLSSSSPCFLPEHSSVESLSSEEGWKAPDSGTSGTSKTYGVTTSPQSRCVKFSLPEKPKRNHKEK